ncbi:MIND kinetochore complex component Nnf1 [Histoplasma capsulatum var. duboisii H88]|uniref:MIND kinetochore complex component Nnf1 n=1 Tax=Ajellomyces capsulatus (strain H88) TaxID=544711 RepID=A0A8A1LW22_AJEC8|nr:MIND kinetochore complex component Nnf1 [Histoplasma capsulatum var. duboisii H88]
MILCRCFTFDVYELNMDDVAESCISCVRITNNSGLKKDLQDISLGFRTRSHPGQLSGKPIPCPQPKPTRRQPYPPLSVSIPFPSLLPILPFSACRPRRQRPVLLLLPLLDPVRPIRPFWQEQPLRDSMSVHFSGGWRHLRWILDSSKAAHPSANDTSPRPLSQGGSWVNFELREVSSLR